MKLSEWAKKQGISYMTAWRWCKNGKMPCKITQTDTGTIIVHESKSENKATNVIIYARVSSYDRKDGLDGQVHRCIAFANENGLEVNRVYKEIASGMNDKRNKLMKLLDSEPTHIIIEHKDRLTRFGFNYIEKLLSKQNCKILVLNRDSEDETDLIKDMISIITSFCCRLYGLRRGNNKAKKIKQEIVGANQDQ